MTTRKLFGVLCLVAGCCLAQEQSPLTLRRIIPLPGVEGRIDHLSADVNGKRLFVAALGNGSVEVVNLAAGKVIHTIGHLKEPQGVLYLSENNRLYVATGGDGALRIFDGTSFKLIQTLQLGDDADNIRYDSHSRQIYVGYGSGALAIINPQGRREGEIRLSAHPESFQIAQDIPRIFVNVPGAHEIAVVDRDTKAVIAKWGTGSTRANFPMALDERDRKLFVVCRHPARILALDTNSGNITANLPSVGDADDLFYDASRQELYATGGEGAIAIYAQQKSTTLRQIGSIPTAPGARTSLFIPQLNRFFVAAPRRGAQSAKLYEFEVK